MKKLYEYNPAWPNSKFVGYDLLGILFHMESSNGFTSLYFKVRRPIRYITYSIEVLNLIL